MNAERNVMERKLALNDVKNSYAAEANVSPASTVDELHQEISVSSIMFYIHLFCVSFTQ